MKKTPLLQAMFWVTILGILILVGFFLVGTFFDYQISSWFTNLSRQNFYGVFFEIFGAGIYTIPGMFIVVVLGNWYAFTKTKPRWIKFRFWFYSFLGLVLLLLTTIPGFQKNMPLNWIAWAIGSVFYLVAYLVIIWYFNQRSEIQKFQKHYYRLEPLLAIVIYSVITYFTVYCLKLIFARPRIINILDDQASYQPWWAIDWKNHNLKYNSFPSGHVGIAMSLLGILFFFPKNHWKFWILGGSFWLLILLIAGSRIVYLRHFLTDVTCAMLLGVGYFYFGRWIAKQRWFFKSEVAHD